MARKRKLSGTKEGLKKAFDEAMDECERSLKGASAPMATVSTCKYGVTLFWNAISSLPPGLAGLKRRRR